MRSRSAAALALLAWLATPGTASDRPVAYTLRYSAAEPGRIAVEIRPGGPALPQTLVVPRAIPMGYGEQPFDRFVSGVEARAPDGVALPVTRGEGPRWRIDGPGRLEVLRYRVDLQRLESEIHSAADASKARPGYVGLLGYSVLGFLEGHVVHRDHAGVRTPSALAAAPEGMGDQFSAGSVGEL